MLSRKYRLVVNERLSFFTLSKRNFFGFLTMLLVSFIWYFAYLRHDSSGIFDWPKDQYYFDYLREYLIEHFHPPLNFVNIPQEISWYPTLKSGSSYFGNPETPFISPLMGTAFLPSGYFFKSWFVLHLIIAAYGCSLVGKVTRLGSAWSVILFCFIFLNPWLIQHLIIGYTPWLTICWIPLSVALACKRHWIASGLILSIVIYEGGLHVFIWLLLASIPVIVGLYFYRLKNLAKIWLLSLGSSIVFSSPRLIATYLTQRDLTDRPINSSYGSFFDIYNLLTNTTANPYDLPTAYNMWGVNLYDGQFIIGAYAIVVMSAMIILWIRNVPKGLSTVCLSGFIVFIFLGWNGVWFQTIKFFHAPSIEIYPYRFLPIAFLFILILVSYILAKLVHSKKHIVTKVATLMLLTPMFISYFNQCQYYIDQVPNS